MYIRLNNVNRAIEFEYAHANIIEIGSKLDNMIDEIIHDKTP